MPRAPAREGDGQNGKVMRSEQGDPLSLLVLAWEKVNKVKEVAAIFEGDSGPGRTSCAAGPEAGQVTANLREMKLGQPELIQKTRRRSDLARSLFVSTRDEFPEPQHVLTKCSSAWVRRDKASRGEWFGHERGARQNLARCLASASGLRRSACL
jgi:hypothetical protein